MSKADQKAAMPREGWEQTYKSSAMRVEQVREGELVIPLNMAIFLTQTLLTDTLAQERAELRERVEGMKKEIHEVDSEGFGWELLEEKEKDKCCPGDDVAFAYEKALDRVLTLLDEK